MSAVGVQSVSKLLLESYATVAAFSLMMYDYVLKLDSEVDLIWLRYIGMCYGIAPQHEAITWRPSSMVRENVGILSVHVYCDRATKQALALVNIYALYAITQVVSIALVQGIWLWPSRLMAMRVYCLLAKPKGLLPILIVGFIASQSLAIMGFVVAVRFDNNMEMYVFNGLHISIPSDHPDRAWVVPTKNGAMLAYQLLLTVLVLCYAWKRLPRRFWKAPVFSAGTLAEAVIYGNLVYFALAVTQLGLAAFTFVPESDGSVSYLRSLQMFSFLWICMAGPCMILGLRRRSEADVDGGSFAITKATEMRFARDSLHSIDIGMDMGNA
ncbi:hypothetical protein CONPUDRAFT_78219 [Coniophora puteana RWD-64-598 SS2]|uniref:DUF6533 domain-containing protein n=1 Tax=Coniophora puteana (strain RWD-64-598) TaxID=741705 RepID=R7SEU6_CONPW|nr:uncharacterized protein CONPUDRAFT_78219 [Coniophora puteana RWD-64-598 SS2]EIW74257.1 hypothetical protein CONPUDRAFT_78219 [Coniophora puteana RWD-64-598 SS2]